MKYRCLSVIPDRLFYSNIVNKGEMYLLNFVIMEVLDIFVFAYIRHEEYNNLIYLITKL